jgi:hypothetical protein
MRSGEAEASPPTTKQRRGLTPQQIGLVQAYTQALIHHYLAMIQNQ